MLGTKMRQFTPVQALSLDELVPADHFSRDLEQVAPGDTNLHTGPATLPQHGADALALFARTKKEAFLQLRYGIRVSTLLEMTVGSRA